MLDRLKAPRGANKKRKRLGRGDSSGHGGTSGRGHKGQRARSGGKGSKGFEGGQMPLQRRLPKRGFVNEFKEYYRIVNVGDLSAFVKDAVVDTQTLKEKGLIKGIREKVKILGDGEISIPLTVKVNKFSASAVKKIEAAGGKVEVV
ncbi:MAG: 50S ribosomal protein L15 [Deltaproteobacteria bacterium GWC2_42_11]|nr:MAG: 50S ribosomal protein L15 [Deltaproteobacteria bacterium GWC2_42_11]HBO85239.1 50S ribosomal protein L15 [Deltaproteobacteria bacterium]